MLIAFICIAEACMSYNAFVQVVNPVYFACYFGLDQLFTWTLFRNPNYIVPNNTEGINELQCSLNTLCVSNGIFF